MHTHHAYYVEGPLSLFEEYKKLLQPFWAQKYERLSIDEARELRALAALKRVGETLYLLGVSSIASEAQQALLKLFEEPQEGSVFVLLLPHGVLLPTLRSRMLRYPDDFQQGLTLLKSASVFLAGSAKVRSDMVAEIIKDDEGAKERARELLNGLEELLVKKIKDPAARAGLEDVAKVRNYLNDRSPSLKMLLEHLALCLPKS